MNGISGPARRLHRAARAESDGAQKVAPTGQGEAARERCPSRAAFCDYDDCDGQPWSVCVFVHADAGGLAITLHADLGSHDLTRSPFDPSASLFLDAPEVSA